MKKSVILAAALCLAGQANAVTIYGVDENNNLVTFDSSAPGMILSSVGISGIDNSLGALDFRPINGVLYGLGSDRVVYTINTGTGAATAVSGVLALAGTNFAFDFNPTIDRLRIVSNTNDNYVFNPNDGSLTVATQVMYAAGDPNSGANPDITAGAYTSSIFGAAAGTTQLYSIDTALDVLTTQANSAGTLNTVGSLGVDLGSRTSFDISGPDAFAFNDNNLYRVNLATGALTSLGSTGRGLFGIAIAAPVPEPESWLLMIAGFAAIGLTLRRRATQLSFA